MDTLLSTLIWAAKKQKTKLAVFASRGLVQSPMLQVFFELVTCASSVAAVSYNSIFSVSCLFYIPSPSQRHICSSDISHLEVGEREGCSNSSLSWGHALPHRHWLTLSETHTWTVRALSLGRLLLLPSLVPCIVLRDLHCLTWICLCIGCCKRQQKQTQKVKQWRGRSASPKKKAGRPVWENS